MTLWFKGFSLEITASQTLVDKISIICILEPGLSAMDTKYSTEYGAHNEENIIIRPKLVGMS